MNPYFEEVSKGHSIFTIARHRSIPSESSDKKTFKDLWNETALLLGYDTKKPTHGVGMNLSIDV
jgi:hypothetical protein